MQPTEQGQPQTVHQGSLKNWPRTTYATHADVCHVLFCFSSYDWGLFLFFSSSSPFIHFSPVSSDHMFGTFSRLLQKGPLNLYRYFNDREHSLRGPKWRQSPRFWHKYVRLFCGRGCHQGLFCGRGCLLMATHFRAEPTATQQR